LRDKKDKTIAKILCLSKQKKLLKEHEKKIYTSLNELDELDKLEVREPKKYEEKKRAERDI
jgi:hypothetical protein